MKNYKIRVNSGAESKEAQELFEKIGYEKGACGTGKYPATIIAVTKSMHRDTPFSSEATRLNHDAHKYYIELDFKQLRALVAEKDGFISGKEALIALANDEEVEFKNGNGDWVGMSINDLIGHIELRLKPKTIKLEIEVPAPFKPKHGDVIWFINPDDEHGYSDGDYDPAEGYCQFGAWRTEEQIKQVVSALRSIFK